MTKKIFHTILKIAYGVLFLTILIAVGSLYRYLGRVQENKLVEQMQYAAAGVEESGLDYLMRFQDSESRITWIDGSGAVIYDSQAEAQSMENHMDREEVREAAQTGTGRSSRYSNTLLEKNLYYAVRLSDGSVLRLAASQHSVLNMLLGMFPPLTGLMVAMIFLAFWLSNRVASQIVDPLNHLDLEHPLDNDVYEEISPMLRHMEAQNRRIQTQMEELKEREDEFETISGGMTEGLILLDSEENILSMNAMAQRFTGVQDAFKGKKLYTEERSRSVWNALRECVKEGKSEANVDRNGRNYRIRCTKVEKQGEKAGTVLLIVDDTAKVQAEQNRRDFTANVSHELKTPLQTIMGSAEMLETGMVKPEDYPRFTGHIRREASRLLGLINDIIRLSQLETQPEPEKAEVNLNTIISEIQNHLKPAAADKQVQLHMEAADACVISYPGLLYDIVYNLTDNAIKYNKPEGNVNISLKTEGGCLRILAEDTGIGIPLKDQDRVFERFYRVDKSRSREGGGTGLGLSIVKHSVEILKGKIDLESVPGTGTRIQIIIPLYA